MSSQGCPVCGDPNPAGSAFCRRCGNPLPVPEATVGARPPPAAPVPGPVQPPVSSRWGQPPTQTSPPPALSPYYQPGGMPPRVSRSSPGLIVGVAALALIALVVLSLAGFVVVRHLTFGPQAARPSPAPVTTPSAPPTAPPTRSPRGGGGGTVTTGSFSLDPGRFQVAKQTGTEVDLQGSSGAIAVAAGRPSASTTTSEELSRIQQQLESQYGSLQTCVASRTLTIGGKSGTIEGWQYADTDASGNQVQVCDAYWVDAAPTGTLYEYEQLGPGSSWNSSLEPAARPVRQSIRWLV